MAAIRPIRRLLSTTQRLKFSEEQWLDHVREGFIGSVGKTPLVKLKGPSEETGCNILAKIESMQPGGSVKDRAALYLVKDAEERGLCGFKLEMTRTTHGLCGVLRMLMRLCD
eukprot:TRINITY_DN4654_c0_g1_i1.p2 TRINITY_DN4654_c0_g1~~TRINITY_DN4654_c0_g1_i1.p2  ORF type:complete len:112 (+),score=21.74 TRINITY_DN4654_c0_g1_i1:131-466(+)